MAGAQRRRTGGKGGKSAGAAGGGGSSQETDNAAIYARRFQCSAETVLAFATGCRRENEGIGSMCSRQEHEMDIGQTVYFYNGTSKSLPTAYCASMECFLGELHESTIFHECGKKLIAGMMVCQTCNYKSDVEGGMAQCEEEGHSIKTYKTKREYGKDHAQEEDEESHTFHAYQIMQDQKFATLWDTEAVLYYENGVYLVHGEMLVKILAEKRVENCTSHMRKEILETIKVNTTCKRDRFDAIPEIVNVKNGLLDTETMEFREHDPTHLSRVQINAEYRPEAAAPEFEKFLGEVIPDEDDQDTLLEVLSTGLVGNHVNLEKIVMFLGEGGNGKSTLLEVVTDVFGGDNISHVSLHQIIEERFARADLDGKLLNIYADISGDEIRNLGVIKSLVTGEPVMAEYKGQPTFVLRNKAKLIFSANRLPDIGEDSDAVFRRFIIIHFPVQFDGSSDNPKLKGVLTTEAEKSGILNMLLAALARVRKNGGKLTHRKTIDSLRDTWRIQSDPVKRFSAECLRREEGYSEAKDDVYQAYVAYARRVKEQPMENHRFSRRMSSLGHRYGKARVGGKAVNVWYDVRIAMSAEEEDGDGADDGGDESGNRDGGASAGAGLVGGGGDAGGDNDCVEHGMVRLGTPKGGGRRPGGRDGIVLDVLKELCEAGSGDNGAKTAVLVEELGKTGMFPSGRDVEKVMARLGDEGWIVVGGGGGGGGDGDDDSSAAVAVDGTDGKKPESGRPSDGKSGDGIGVEDGTARAPAAATGAAHTGAASDVDATTTPKEAAGGAMSSVQAPPPAGDGEEAAKESNGRKFRCLSCPAGPFDEFEAGFGGKRMLDYHTGDNHRVEWLD